MILRIFMLSFLADGFRTQVQNRDLPTTSAIAGTKAVDARYSFSRLSDGTRQAHGFNFAGAPETSATNFALPDRLRALGRTSSGMPGGFGGWHYQTREHGWRFPRQQTPPRGLQGGIRLTGKVSSGAGWPQRLWVPLGFYLRAADVWTLNRQDRRRQHFKLRFLVGYSLPWAFICDADGLFTVDDIS
jgi:hypothetical protein